MKSTPLVCSALIASLGFATVAQAQPEHHWRGDADHGQQWRGRGAAGPQQHWQQRQGAGQHWQAPAYQQRQYAPQYNRGWQGYRHEAPRSYAYGGYYAAPHYRPYYRSYYGPSYYVGGYAPAFVARRYWINDWRARHLYAPPYGYEWVEADNGDVLLIALATGLIANAILAAH